MPDLNTLWYGRSPLVLPLVPLSWLYCAVVGLRRLAYRWGLRRSQRLNVPVIVVGNLTVGGTGKTPLVTWLVGWLREHGYRPGLVARGYGGQARHWPQQVRADSDPVMVGDEPVLLVRATGCPMAVAPDRVAAARALLAHSDCDVIISDDGLQHYALARDVEVVVVDGVRRFGNGYCLPAGPLREPAARIRAVDFVVSNGMAGRGEYVLKVSVGEAVNFATGEQRPLTQFRGSQVFALAGIGQPERFFEQLRQQGLNIEARAFPDHHPYTEADLAFANGPLLMTEKDAVKCRRFGGENRWAVTADVRVDERFGAKLLERLRQVGGDAGRP